MIAFRNDSVEERTGGMSTQLQPDDTLGILVGRDYVYTSLLPKVCQGHRYRAHFFVLDVPTYQWKVCIEALTGPDKGLWFTCSLANFVPRYRLVLSLQGGSDAAATE